MPAISGGNGLDELPGLDIVKRIVGKTPSSQGRRCSFKLSRCRRLGCADSLARMALQQYLA